MKEKICPVSGQKVKNRDFARTPGNSGLPGFWEPWVSNRASNSNSNRVIFSDRK
jgi:hypothetical protein